MGVTNKEKWGNSMSSSLEMKGEFKIRHLFWQGSKNNHTSKNEDENNVGSTSEFAGGVAFVPVVDWLLLFVFVILLCDVCLLLQRKLPSIRARGGKGTTEEHERDAH
jgi:hypothetical protein